MIGIPVAVSWALVIVLKLHENKRTISFLVFYKSILLVVKHLFQYFF